MIQKRRESFVSIRSEGGILPADLIQRIAAGDRTLEGLSENDYYLITGERLNEVINRSWNRLQAAWSRFITETSGLTQDDAGTSITRERWLLPLFAELGYGRLQPNRAIEIGGKTYPISHVWQQTPIHLVGSRVDLDRRTRRIAGAAQASPHGLVQELLNRSDSFLWGFVSNGRQLRILRDSTALTRQSYVEFDLEAIMAGEVYSEFFLLWLLCHQSRVETAKVSEDCWLEKWSKAAAEQGTRALDALRVGVENSITALGQGFLRNPLNRSLREQLRSGELSPADYLRQLRRVVYRLLFLFVAEDRELLFPPAASEIARSTYLAYYSTGRLRRLCETQRGARHPDLYNAFSLIIAKLGSREGYPPLGLPALGSALFSTASTTNLADCVLSNRDFLDAVRSLAFTQEGGIRRLVDYRNLRSDELGSVYESLLELHPELNVDAGTFELKTASGNERKTTGAYYTPESLVQCILDTTLDPVLARAVRQSDPEKAILSLKICDPACGSGHFLIGAAHRVARRLASVRTGDIEPSPSDIRHALRDVIAKCLYGVDKNPDAIELCKFALWMESLDPGLSLSFLDHHIQCGNSLLGATPTLIRQGIPDAAFEPIEGDDKAACYDYRRQNRHEREQTRMVELFEAPPWEQLGNFPGAMMQIEIAPDKTVDDETARQERYERLVRQSEPVRLLADAWCAAFVWKKRTSDTKPPYCPFTNEYFRRLLNNPNHLEGWMKAEIVRLREKYQFFHWHLVFPTVFWEPAADEEPGNEQAGWCGGFDVVVGNPPWERVKLQEKEWFAVSRPDIACAPNAAARRRLIDALAVEDPNLFDAYREDRRQAEGEGLLLHLSGRFPLTGRGDINTYAVFAETSLTILSPHGLVGLIVPSGIATDDTTKYLFRHLARNNSLVSLFSFENEELLFPDVHHAMKFCLLTIGAQNANRNKAEFLFYARQVSALLDSSRRFTLSAEEIDLLNPNTGTCAVFRGVLDAEISKAIYRRVPILLAEGADYSNPWNISFMAMLHMSGDSGLFRTHDQLRAAGGELIGNHYIISESVEIDGINIASGEWLPLYEAKMIHQFDHRFATYEGATEANMNAGILPQTDTSLKVNPQSTIKPKYWIEERKVRDRLVKFDRDGNITWQWNNNWFLGFRSIARSTDQRTLIASMMPISAVSGKLPLILGTTARQAGLLLANLNSFICDYCVRQKIGGTDLALHYVKQFPIVPPSRYSEIVTWDSNHPELADWILARVVELTYTADDMAEFAGECGYFGDPFAWNESRRFLLRCELDAIYLYLYDISREDANHIMEIFPIVKRKDEEKYGEYRTKSMILKIYDAMQEAIVSGQPYCSSIDPPPAMGWLPAADVSGEAIIYASKQANETAGQASAGSSVLAMVSGQIIDDESLNQLNTQIYASGTPPSSSK